MANSEDYYEPDDEESEEESESEDEEESGVQPLSEESSSGVEGAEPLAFKDVSEFPLDFNYKLYNIQIDYDVADDAELATRYEITEAPKRLKSIELLKTNKKIFAGLNLFGADLTDYNFTECVFISCIFMNAEMDFINMKNSVLYNCNFVKANLEGGNLWSSFIYDCAMEGANCENANFQYVVVEYPTNGSRLDNEFLEETTQTRRETAGQLPETESDKIKLNMTNTTFERASFDFARLTQVNFSSSIMPFVSMISCSVYNCLFEETLLAEANFTDANLTRTRFTLAKGKQVCFNNAKLYYTNFDSADFRHGDFRRSSLKHCNFQNCNLKSSLLKHSTKLFLKGNSV